MNRPSWINRFETRFERDEPGKCWLWTADRAARYGRFWIDGKAFGAHAVAWTLANGRWPEPGEVVRHACDVPKCVNPSHLLIGSPEDNTRDMIERGRAVTHSWFTRASTCRRGHDLTLLTNRTPSRRGQPYGECRTCANDRRRESRAAARRATVAGDA